MSLGGHSGLALRLSLLYSNAVHAW